MLQFVLVISFSNVGLALLDRIPVSRIEHFSVSSLAITLGQMQMIPEKINNKQVFLVSVSFSSCGFESRRRADDTLHKHNGAAAFIAGTKWDRRSLGSLFFPYLHN